MQRHHHSHGPNPLSEASNRLTGENLNNDRLHKLGAGISSALPPTPEIPFHRLQPPFASAPVLEGPPVSLSTFIHATSASHHFPHNVDDIPDDHSSFVLQDVEKSTNTARLRVGGAPGLRGSNYPRKQPIQLSVSSSATGVIGGGELRQQPKSPSATSNSTPSFVSVVDAEGGVLRTPKSHENSNTSLNAISLGRGDDSTSGTDFAMSGKTATFRSPSLSSQTTNDGGNGTNQSVSASFMRHGSTLGTYSHLDRANPTTNQPGQFFQPPSAHTTPKMGVSKAPVVDAMPSAEAVFHPLASNQSGSSQRSNNSNVAPLLSAVNKPTSVSSPSNAQNPLRALRQLHTSDSGGAELRSGSQRSLSDFVNQSTPANIHGPDGANPGLIRSMHRNSRMSVLSGLGLASPNLLGGVLGTSQMSSHDLHNHPMSNDATVRGALSKHQRNASSPLNLEGPHNPPSSPNRASNEQRSEQLAGAGRHVSDTIEESWDETESLESDFGDNAVTTESSIMGIMERLLFDLKSVTFDQRIEWASPETYLQNPITMKFVDFRVENEFCRSLIDHKSVMATCLTICVFVLSFLPLMDSHTFTDSALRPQNLTRVLKLLMTFVATSLSLWSLYRIRQLKRFVERARARTAQEQHETHRQQNSKSNANGNIDVSTANGDFSPSHEDAITASSLPLFSHQEKEYIRHEKLSIYQIQLISAVLAVFPTCVFAYYSVHLDRVFCLQGGDAVFVVQPSDKEAVCAASISGIAIVASYVPVGLSRPTFPILIAIAVCSLIGLVVGFFLLPYDVGDDNPFLETMSYKTALQAGSINVLCVIASCSILWALEYSSRRRFQTHAQTLARLQLYMHQRAQLVTFVDSLVSPVVRQRLFERVSRENTGSEGGVQDAGTPRSLAAASPGGTRALSAMDTNPCCTVVIADVANVNTLFLKGENSVGPLLKFGQLIAIMCDSWGMERICFVGDLVCVSCNVLTPCDDHSLKSIRFGIALQQEVHKKKLLMKLRVGVHSGRVVGSVVGSSTLQYALFGEAVQCAQALLNCATGGEILATEITIKMCGGLVSTMPSIRSVEITTNRASGIPVLKSFNVFTVLGCLDANTANAKAMAAGKQSFHGHYGEMRICDEETDLPLVQLHDIGSSLRTMSLTFLETPKAGGAVSTNQQAGLGSETFNQDLQSNFSSNGSMREWDRVSRDQFIPVNSSKSLVQNVNDLSDDEENDPEGSDADVRVFNTPAQKHKPAAVGDEGGEEMNPSSNSTSTTPHKTARRHTRDDLPVGAFHFANPDEPSLAPNRGLNAQSAVEEVDGIQQGRSERRFSCSSFSRDVNALLDAAELLDEEDEELEELLDYSGGDLGFPQPAAVKALPDPQGLALEESYNQNSQVLSINSMASRLKSDIRNADHINAKGIEEGWPSLMAASENLPPANRTPPRNPLEPRDSSLHKLNPRPAFDTSACKKCDGDDAAIPSRQKAVGSRSRLRGAKQFNVAELIGSSSEEENRRNLLKLYRALRTVTQFHLFEVFKYPRAEYEFQRVSTYWNLFIFSAVLVNIAISSIVLFIIALTTSDTTSSGRYLFLPVIFLCTLSATYNVLVVRGQAAWRTHGRHGVILHGCFLVKAILFVVACDNSHPAPSGNSLFFAFCMVSMGLPFYPNPSRWKWAITLITLIVVLPFQLFVNVTSLQTIDLALWVIFTVSIVTIAEVHERAMRSMCIEEHLKTAVTFMCREEELRRQAVLNSVIPPPLQRQLLLNTDVNGNKKDASIRVTGTNMPPPSKNQNFFDRVGGGVSTTNNTKFNAASSSRIPIITQPAISANYVHHQQVIVMCIRLDHILSELHYKRSAEVLAKALRVVERALREANRCFHMLIGDPRYPEWRAPDEESPLSIAKLFGDRLYIIGPLVEVGYPGQFFREVALSAVRALQVLSAYSQLTTKKRTARNKTFPSAASKNDLEDGGGSLMNSLGRNSFASPKGGVLSPTQHDASPAAMHPSSIKPTAGSAALGGFRFTASIASGSMISTLTRTQFPTYEMFGSPLYAVRGLLDAVPVLPPSMNPTARAGWRADSSTPSVHAQQPRRGLGESVKSESYAWLSSAEQPSMVVVEESVVKACLSLLALLKSVARQLNKQSNMNNNNISAMTDCSVSTIGGGTREKPPSELTRARYAMLSSLKRAAVFGKTDTWRIKCFGKIDVRMVTFNYAETQRSRKSVLVRARRQQLGESVSMSLASDSRPVLTAGSRISPRHGNPMTFHSKAHHGPPSVAATTNHRGVEGFITDEDSLAETALLAASGPSSIAGSRPSTVRGGWMVEPAASHNKPPKDSTNAVATSSAAPRRTGNAPTLPPSDVIASDSVIPTTTTQRGESLPHPSAASRSGGSLGLGPLFFNQISSQGAPVSLPPPHNQRELPTRTLAEHVNGANAMDAAPVPFMIHALRPRDDLNKLVSVTNVDNNRSQEQSNADLQYAIPSMSQNQQIAPNRQAPQGRFFGSSPTTSREPSLGGQQVTIHHGSPQQMLMSPPSQPLFGMGSLPPAQGFYSSSQVPLRGTESSRGAGDEQQGGPTVRFQKNSRFAGMF